MMVTAKLVHHISVWNLRLNSVARVCNQIRHNSSQSDTIPRKHRPILPAYKDDQLRDSRKLLRGNGEAVDAESRDQVLYPMIKQLGIITNGISHSLEINCDKVLKFIKFGAINKSLAAQYCFYISDLARKSSEESDKKHFERVVFELMVYIARSSKDVPVNKKLELMIDVMDISAKMCNSTFKLLIQMDELLEALAVSDFTRVLSVCYDYDEWDLCNVILDKKIDTLKFRATIYDHLIEAMHRASVKYSKSNTDVKKKLRAKVLENLFKVFDGGYRHAIPLIASNPNKLIEALENFHVKVTENPFIKAKGRCTKCETRLPLLDHRGLPELNRAIKELLHTQIENLKMYSTPAELERFQSYIQHINLKGRPIDLVIDGLNIAYRHSDEYVDTNNIISGDLVRTRRRQNIYSSVQNLMNTLIRGNIVDDFRNILIIGKKHMYSWPRLIEFLEKNDIKYFFTSDTSKDDLFMIYASTLSPSTVILSCDLLRDHAALLSTENQIYFERWLDTRQAWVLRKTLKPVWPTSFEKLPSYNRDSATIHLPVIDRAKIGMQDNDAPPSLNKRSLAWYCCRIMPELAGSNKDRLDPFLTDPITSKPIEID